MADLKAIGSEKLKGNAKIRRIMEIARYGETPQNKEYHNTTVSFSKKAPNGVTYAIVQEKDGYYVKSGINESKLDYADGVHNKKKNRFRSYSSALKRINLMLKPINEEYNNGKATSLFEQYTTVVANEQNVMDKDDTKEGEDEEVDEQEKFVLNVPDEGGEEEIDMEDEGDDEDMDIDMDVEGDDDEDMDMDMDIEDDGEDEEMDMDIEGGEEEEMEGFMKPIQKLTGKLGQKLRDAEEELGSEDIKYVLNSIISAVDLDNLEEEDRDDILERFEEDDLDYGMEDDIDIESGDEEFEMGDEEMGDDEDMDMEDEEMDDDEDMDMEDEEMELSEQFKEMGDDVKKFFKWLKSATKIPSIKWPHLPKVIRNLFVKRYRNKKRFKGCTVSACPEFDKLKDKAKNKELKSLETEGGQSGDEEPAPTTADTQLESRIAKTLKKYFKASKEEKVLHERKIKKFIKGKINETNLKNSINSHTIEQELSINRLIKEGKINKFRGETKAGVLYFENKSRRPVGINKRGKLVR